MRAFLFFAMASLSFIGCDSSPSGTAADPDIVVAFTDTLDTETTFYGLSFDGALDRLAIPSGDLFTPNCSGRADAVVFESYNASLVRGTPALQVYRDGRVQPAPPDPTSPLGALPVVHGLLSSNAWSPDGRRFVATTSEGCLPAVGCFHRDLTVIDIEADTVTPLTRGSDFDWNPLWDPYGDRIVFLSDRSGAQHVYSVRPDGSDLTELAPLPGEINQLSWGPGPATLTARIRNGDGLFRFIAIDLETKQVQDLAIPTDPKHTANVAWHPDGRRYLSTVRTPFQATPHPNDVHTLYVTDTQTGERRALLERTKEISHYLPSASFCAP